MARADRPSAAPRPVTHAAPRAALALVMVSVACAGVDHTAASAPTYAADIAPLFAQHCVGCHRPGHAAPFSLLTFADAQPRAAAIARAVGDRRMPPWLPEHGRPAFVGERRLDEAQVATIARWAATGAAEGRRSAVAPAAPASRWALGEPGLVATMPRPYVLPAGGHDVYRNVILRLALADTRYVRAVEFDAGSAPIHHAVVRVDNARASRARDGADGQPGFDGMAALDVADPEGHFLGWAPGRGPIVSPDGMPWVLRPGADLVVELHLMPGDTDAEVAPAVGLYFTDREPVAAPVMLVMGSKAIDIPAGVRDHPVEDRFELPVDVQLLSVYPHAHYLGRTMTVQAIAPDGTTRQLLHIPRWSFNWQQDYRLVQPMALARGTAIVMRYTYDNSQHNPDNPHHPPRRVTWGPQSHDEMGNLGLQLLTRTTGEAAALTRAFTAHAAHIDVAGAETLATAYPDDAGHAVFLGTSYMRVGRYAEAAAALDRARQLDPRSSLAANHLGGALLALGRGGDALVQFRDAVRLAPRDAHIRFNLARVLADAGHGDEAYREYRRVLSIAPDLPEAHQHLGVLLFGGGRVAEAIAHLTRAAALAPSSASAHADLGGALAQAGRLDEARAHLRQALALDPAHPTARENLARLDRLSPR